MLNRTSNENSDKAERARRIEEDQEHMKKVKVMFVSGGILAVLAVVTIVVVAMVLGPGAIGLTGAAVAGSEMVQGIVTVGMVVGLFAGALGSVLGGAGHSLYNAITKKRSAPAEITTSSLSAAEPVAMTDLGKTKGADHSGKKGKNMPDSGTNAEQKKPVTMRDNVTIFNDAFDKLKLPGNQSSETDLLELCVLVNNLTKNVYETMDKYGPVGKPPGYSSENVMIAYNSFLNDYQVIYNEMLHKKEDQKVAIDEILKPSNELRDYFFLKLAEKNPMLLARIILAAQESGKAENPAYYEIACIIHGNPKINQPLLKYLAEPHLLYPTESKDNSTSTLPLSIMTFPPRIMSSTDSKDLKNVNAPSRK